MVRKAVRPRLTTFLAARLGQAVLVLWAAYTVTFVILFALPSDPVARLLGGDGSDLTDGQIEALRQRLGLDQPLPVQYATQLIGVLRGDLGRSIVSGRPVGEILLEAAGPTAQIALLGLVLAGVLGVAIALIAHSVRSRTLTTLVLSLPPLGVAVPSFWLALILIQTFSFGLPLFPSAGTDGFASAILPAVTLAVPASAAIAQVLARSLLETLDEPYIDTAVAKGASHGRVLWRHALRNAALPTLTVAGLVVGALFSGAVVTETVFSRPGLGRVAARAVESQDIPVVQAVVLVAALLFTTTTLLVDLVTPLLDPRLGTRTRASDRRRRQDPEPSSPSSEGAP